MYRVSNRFILGMRSYLCLLYTGSWYHLATIMILLLTLAGGCSLRLPAPTVRSGRITSDIDPRPLCAYAGIPVENGESSSSATSVSLECSEKSLVIVVFNAFGIRVRTITINSDKSFHDEISYMANSAEDAEAVVVRLLDLLHASSRRN